MSLRRRGAHADHEDGRCLLFEVVPHDDRCAIGEPAIDESRSEVTARDELHKLLFRRSPETRCRRQDPNVVALTDLIDLECDVDVSIAALFPVRS